MIPFGLRWRLAQGASNIARQVTIGVIATAIASVLLPIGARGPAAAPTPSKISLRAEPDAPERPLLQQVSASEAVPAVIPDAHVFRPVHRPKPVVAILPPERPHEPIVEVAASPGPAPTLSGWDWLAPSRAAADITASAIDASKRWALEGKDWAGRTAADATTVVGQVVKFGP